MSGRPGIPYPKYYRQIYNTLAGATNSNVHLSVHYDTEIHRFYKGQRDTEPYKVDRLRTKSYTWMILLISEKK